MGEILAPTGFPMAKLVELARPLSSAKFVRMETFLDTKIAPGQRQTWYPWPYVEGVTMAELIRRALDQYLQDEVDPATALASTFGAAPEAEVPFCGHATIAYPGTTRGG